MKKRLVNIILTVIMVTHLLPLKPLEALAEETLVNPMVSAGNYRTVALKANGEVWAWGDNDYGQLGDGTTNIRKSPIKVDITGVKQISAGIVYTVALKENGEVWAWGYNYSGQLGDGTTTDRHTPVKADITGVKQISAGLHTIALKENGEVWAWGDNRFGQLGDGTTTDRHTPAKVDITGVKQISVVRKNTVALKENGEVWTWGDNSLGQLGDGTTTDRHTPVKVDITGVKQISAGDEHTVALKENGEVWAWGRNCYGQLGDGTTTEHHTPVKAKIAGVKQILTGYGYTVALKENGEVWAWGLNNDGQLGDGTTASRYTPVKVDITGVKQISAGDAHTVALKENGEVWGWGANEYGQLGDGTTTTRYTPVKVPDINLGEGIEKVEKDITAYYRSDLLGTNKELKFYYSDDYFVDNNAYTYNHDLARASLALELSAWTQFGADDLMEYSRMYNVDMLYKELGFDEDSITPYNYDDPLWDNSDKVAYSFATKKLYDGSTLVAVVVRGGGYGAEWRSNFHVGSGTKHIGFNTPAEEVYENLSSYIAGLDTSNTKIWITGYSRGGAVANLVSGRINETGLINSDNLYCYTFATPNGVMAQAHDTQNPIHNNIYNIVLPYDIVPKVAMERWGYWKYGQTMEFPSINPTNIGAQEEYFKEFTGKKYSIGIKQTNASNNAVDVISSFAGSPEVYSEMYEGTVMDIVEWAMCRKHYQDLWTFADERYSDNPEFSDAQKYAMDKARFLPKGIKAMYIILYMNGLGTPDHDEIVDSFVNALQTELDLFGALELVSGIGGVGNSHNPEYYIAWLYGYDNPPFVSESRFKKLTVSSGGNVNVYNSAGNKVACVMDNKIVVEDIPVEVIGESAEIYFYNGEDIDDYRIEIEAYDEGSVNYSVTEYKNNGVETRKINYPNIPVSTGTTLSGNIPKGQELDAELYNLTAKDNEEEKVIEYTEDLSGEELKNLTVDVTVDGDGSASDIYFATKGELVTLEAKPYFDAEFIGWYNENGELLSEKEEYTFVISENMNVTAKFTLCTAKLTFDEIPSVTDNKLSVNGAILAGKDINGKCFVSVYSKDGSLLDVKSTDISLNSNGEYDIDKEFDVSLYNKEPYYVKLFLWKDMTPLAVSNEMIIR